MRPVSAWGRLDAHPHRVLPLTESQSLTTLPQAPGVAHGMGRSYGDVALNPGGTLWLTTGLDRFIAFDPDTGVLHAEAGVLLRDIQRLFAPRGWMLPVTPGTQFVTLGGAIANDVHGKNHHVMGCFGDHVQSLVLLRTDGQRLAVDRASHPDLMRATIGGLGLTGVILEATVRLRPVDSTWLHVESEPYTSLDDYFVLDAAAQADWEYTVSWIDCLSARSARGIFFRANHARREQAQAAGLSERAPSPRARSMPLVPPVSLVNALSLRAFNSAYFHWHARRRGAQWQHHQPFFYPLDQVQHWSRMYGPRGFYQYQCVVPASVGRDATAALLQQIARSGQGSFLAVLKTFGACAPAGWLSFAMPGVTLALDFPNRGEDTLRLFDALDAIVREAGGRLYAAKDARMSRDMFEAGYPEHPGFNAWRDPGLSSALSRRCMGW